MAITETDQHAQVSVNRLTFTDAKDRAMYEKVMSMAKPNPLLERMKAGSLALVFTTTFTRSMEIIGMAKNAGYHGISMNLEHERNSFGEAVDTCIGALLAGITPIAIVPSLQSDWISRLIDNGCQAIIVPRIHNADLARQFVRLSKLRPIGEKPLADCPQAGYNVPDFKWVSRYLNETTLTIPMIESVEGLENCEEIAAVPGIDVIFIGVFDLSDDMGIPGEFYNPKIQNAISRICNAAKAASTPEKQIYIGIGGIEPYPDLLAKFRKQFPAFLFMNAGRDNMMLDDAMRACVKGFTDEE